MKRSALYVLALLPALMALRFGPVTLASGVKMRHTIIAATGAAAPAGGNYVSFFNARLKARPEVAFDAILSGPSSTGVFVGDGSRTSAIALGGNPDPAAGNFGFVNNPFITINGKVVFDVNSENIFASNTRETIPLVQNGDPAPGGGTLIPLVPADVNNGATIAYLAFMNGSTATQGIFRTNGSGTVAIARDDVDAPTGGSFISLRDPVINDFGQVAFEAEMSGGTRDFGIFLGDGGDLVPVFVANQNAPGGGTFSDFGDPVINVRGQVAAVASLANSASLIGLFVGDGTNAIAIALEGQPAPKGGNYDSRLAFLQPLRLNDRGEVAFHVGLTGGTSGQGIFRGDGEQTTTIALAGATAPGTTGTFAAFHDIKLGNDGRIAFIATLTLGVGGVDSSNNMGIWTGTSDEDLQLVRRTGDVIDGHLLTRLSRETGGLSQLDMNETGVVWIGSFQSPAKAIVFPQFLGENVQP
jgi:hypothetical protein